MTLPPPPPLSLPVPINADAAALYGADVAALAGANIAAFGMFNAAAIGGFDGLQINGTGDELQEFDSQMYFIYEASENAAKENMKTYSKRNTPGDFMKKLLAMLPFRSRPKNN